MSRIIIVAAFFMMGLAVAQQPRAGILGKKAPSWGVDTWVNVADDGVKPDVKNYRGKVVYLYCFQSWCPGCHKHGFPTLKALESKYGDQPDVVFVAVQTVFEGFSSNTEAKARAMAERYGLSIPVGHSGAEGKRPPIMTGYRTGGTPWTIVIDRKGIVRFNDFHITVESGSDLIDSLVAEKK